MKIVCDCGAKYAFDVTADNLRSPVTFSCPNCGQDLSAAINQQIHEQFGVASDATTDGHPTTDAGTVDVPTPAVSTSKRPPLRIQLSPQSTSAPADETRATERFCSRHPSGLATQACVVCGKGICAKCAGLFADCCSPLCKEKAALRGEKTSRSGRRYESDEARRLRHFGWLVKLGLCLALLVLGAWLWYAWWGSQPRPVATLRFENDPAFAGTSVITGEQVIFLHGLKLGRYDLSAKRQVWLQSVVDEKMVRAQAEQDLRQMQAMVADGQSRGTIPSLEQRIRDLTRVTESGFQLRVFGHSIWVADGETARQFDWDTGRPQRAVPFSGDFDEARLKGSQLEIGQLVNDATIQLTRLDLVSGQMSTELLGTNSIGGAAGIHAAQSPSDKIEVARKGVADLSAQQLGAAVASGSVAGKLAAPATIAVTRRQQEALQLMAEDDGAQKVGRSSSPASGKMPSAESVQVFPSGSGWVQLTTRLLQPNLVARSAMRAAPAKSALDGGLSAGATTEVANELLNEMARNAGQDKVVEDQSRYAVRLHRLGDAAAPDWEGEVIGAPQLYPQATVNVLVAGTTLLVLDQQNRKKWESLLMYPLAEAADLASHHRDKRYGLGPVVEHDQSLYVFDQGVLSAFDLATGSARWRLPSVGVRGLFFDGAGALYVNTTTASPDRIKYARQIDVSERAGNLTLKLDATNGKERWRYAEGGWLTYASGRYLYAVDYTPPRDDDEDEDQQTLAALGLGTTPHLNIRRLNPKNGRVMWNYYQPHGAWAIEVRDNILQLVLKQEVLILKFLAL